MSDPDYRPLMYYFPFGAWHWAALHCFVPFVRGKQRRAQFAALLDDVQAKAESSFAMVTWNTGDCLAAFAHAFGYDEAEADDLPPLDDLGVTAELVEELMYAADRALPDFMIERGWLVLDQLAADVLREAGIETSVEEGEEGEDE